MKKQYLVTLFLAFFVFVQLPAVAFAAEESEDSTVSDCEVEAENDLRFKIIPYVWAASLNGTVTSEGSTSNLHVGFDEILDDLNVGFIAYVEAEYKKVWVFVDTVFLDVGDSLSSSQVDLDLTFKQTILDAGVGYTLNTWPLGQGTSNISLGVYGGARYNYMDLELDAGTTGSIKETVDWADPLVGLRVKVNFGNDWLAEITSDFGGFGVNSKFTTKLQGIVGYRFTDWFILWAGYRYLYIDYENGSGNNKFTYDMDFYGPLLAFGFYF